MARTPAQRGKIGNWLVESRMARGWDTQAKARAEIERLTGWRIPQSVYAEWESGRRVPSDTNLDRLREFYGPTTGLEATQGPDALAAAIHALVAELRAAREAREADEAWRRSVDSELSHLGQRVDAALQGRSAPRVSTGS